MEKRGTVFINLATTTALGIGITSQGEYGYMLVFLIASTYFAGIVVLISFAITRVVTRNNAEKITLRYIDSE